MSVERVYFERPAEEAAPPILRTSRGEKPHVMIDGFNLALEKGTGVATYSRNLSFALRDLGCEVGVLYGNRVSSGHSALLKEVMFFDPPADPGSPWKHTKRCLRAALRSPHNTAFEVPVTGAVVANTFASRLPYYDSIWNAPDLFFKAQVQFEALRVVNRVSVPRKPDICHWTYPLPIRMPGVPNIYTLHDLVPLRLPYTTLDRKIVYHRLVRWICKTADHIVTVSENSKRDIVELLGVDPDKVTNTYQSVTIPDAYRRKPEDAVRREVEGTFGLKHKQYFLFFGSLEPKKNIGRMIEGYLASGVSAPLVIVGAQAWKAEKELALLDAEKIRGQLGTGRHQPGRRIVKLDYAPFSLLVSLIRGAKAVLFPSLYEGFGLPILEAMLLGTPVLTSNTSSIPEVTGEAALFVNPYDGSAIAEGIRALDRNDNLRAELAALGMHRAEEFTPERYAQRLHALYEGVLATGMAARRPE
jgi:glycosyltransferase involved in cell wall biosynthesis